MAFVAVIDYGMGNLHSIAKALQHTSSNDDTIVITGDPKTILSADKVVFPGVGAMRDCMQALNQTGLVEVIKDVVLTKPLLGICLGMQALMTTSAEAPDTECLNIFSGQVLKFSDHLLDNAGNSLKIPHMGWNHVEQKAHPLWQNIPQNSRFYFVHSYYVQPEALSCIVATANYPTSFPCAIARNNIFAVQFHPEKSQTVGLQLLKNFLSWDGTVAF